LRSADAVTEVLVNEKRGIRILEAVIVVTVAAILLSEALLYVPPGPGGVAVSVSLEGNPGGTVTANYSLLSSVGGHFTAGLLVRNTTAPLTTVYYYYDPAYPSSQSTTQWWFGLPLHLAAVAAARGYALTVVTLNASKLADFLLAPPTPGTVLIIASGVLPHTVFAPNVDLARSWLLQGGHLLWFGGRIGLWSGYPGQSLSYPPSNMGNNGTDAFLNVSTFGGGALWAYTNRSSIATFYNFLDTNAVPRGGLNLSKVAASGGTDIGNDANSFTNAAMFPLGSGLLAYFSIPLESDVTTLSISLVNMLQSGLFNSATVVLASSLVRAPASVRVHGEWVVGVPSSPVISLSTSDICFSLFQTDYLATYGMVSCVPASTVVS
jgi:hypothetical protein